MRSYEISCTIIIQAISQLKTRYKDNWETIMGNCDSLVFLGGQEEATLKYVSERLGKETIVTQTDSRSFGGKGGGSSRSKQIVGRELMTPTEIAEMPTDECIVFIRGIKPFKGKKYDYPKHPNYQYTGDANDDYIYNVRNELHTGNVSHTEDKLKAAKKRLRILAEKSETRNENRVERIHTEGGSGGRRVSARGEELYKISSARDWMENTAKRVKENNIDADSSITLADGNMPPHGLEEFGGSFEETGHSEGGVNIAPVNIATHGEHNNRRHPVNRVSEENVDSHGQHNENVAPDVHTDEIVEQSQTVVSSDSRVENAERENDITPETVKNGSGDVGVTPSVEAVVEGPADEGVSQDDVVDAKLDNEEIDSETFGDSGVEESFDEFECDEVNAVGTEYDEDYDETSSYEPDYSGVDFSENFDEASSNEANEYSYEFDEFGSEFTEFDENLSEVDGSDIEPDETAYSDSVFDEASFGDLGFGNVSLDDVIKSKKTDTSSSGEVVVTHERCEEDPQRTTGN